MRINTRIRAAVAAAGLTAALIPAGAATASATAVGPNQYFTGAVNNTAANATVKVVCPGPIGPGSMGHPIAGQTLEVRLILPPVSSTAGYTGSAAKQIDATIAAPTGALINPPVVLTQYFVTYPIPTSWELPCSGSGVATFTPEPTSTTARSATVSVTFLNIGV